VSGEYARQLGERLKGRIFEKIFPHLSRGFLEDRKQRLGINEAPTEEDLRDVFEAALTLLYRLLFLLYAESRDLLPIDEAPYHEASLTKIKQEVADNAGIARSVAEAGIERTYSSKEYTLYDRLQRLFIVIDAGEPMLNVPSNNGGLFITRPDHKTTTDPTQERALSIARFLIDRKVPDRALALAIDLLSRDEESKTLELVFINYKSLAVRHLGSIYESLLEFKLQLADEDLATQVEKGKEKYIPLSAAKSRRGRSAEVVVAKGEVYLSNDKAERRSSGSYYTPDAIVEYIVEQTIGPVLAEKLEDLRPQFQKACQTFDHEVDKARALPVRKPHGTGWDPHEFSLEKTYETHKDLVEQLFEFRILDPAMGSGHFLVESVDFIADRMLTFLNQFPTNPVHVMLDRTRRNILAALADQGVTVDPAKLTDANLLKRHVLRRCIYGVDLNPMAVELARVSLWLDAYPIGAPLSFLNHHLRCGNSLIGAMIVELKDALQGRPVSIVCDAMERAIHRVSTVYKRTDATVADLKQSADENDHARDQLSAYQILLDLLVARHFGHADALRLLTHIGTEFDPSSRPRFVESLSGTNRLLVQKVRELAQQPDLRFFHWELEFPEVFYGFHAADQHRLENRNEAGPGSRGFDAIVGNPPYSGHKSDFNTKPLTKLYAVCRDYPNPATAFIERSFQSVRRGGRVGLIIPKSIQYVESWQAARMLLAESNRLIRIADVSQAFADVLLEQTVCIASKSQPVDGYLADVLSPQGSTFGKRIDAPLIKATACFPATVDDRSIPLLNYIIDCGPRLREISATSQALEYQALLNQDVTGDHIPIYRGKQVRPMRLDDSIDFIDRSFLESVRDEGLTTKCRDMMRSKVVSQNIVAHVTKPRPRSWVISAPDHRGVLCLNTISTTLIHDGRFSIDYIAAVMNSTLASWFYTEFVFCRAIRTMHFDNHYAGKLPIALINPQQVEAFTKLSAGTHLVDSRGARQRRIDAAVFEAYGLTRDQQQFLYEFCYGTDQIEDELKGF